MLKNDSTPRAKAGAAEREIDTKYLAIGATLLYIVLFLVCCSIWPVLGLLFDSPRMATTLGYSIMCLTLLIPASMPVSIYFIWSKYQRGQHQKVIFFCALPILVFIGIYFVATLLLDIKNKLIGFYVCYQF
jgi:hypothetical protein